jgi:hypothetical protein
MPIQSIRSWFKSWLWSWKGGEEATVAFQIARNRDNVAVLRLKLSSTDSLKRAGGSQDAPRTGVESSHPLTTSENTHTTTIQPTS